MTERDVPVGALRQELFQLVLRPDPVFLLLPTTADEHRLSPLGTSQQHKVKEIAYLLDGCVWVTIEKGESGTQSHLCLAKII